MIMVGRAVLDVGGSQYAVDVELRFDDGRSAGEHLEALNDGVVDDAGEGDGDFPGAIGSCRKLSNERSVLRSGCSEDVEVGEGRRRRQGQRRRQSRGRP
jgi:hypothetical protein